MIALSRESGLNKEMAAFNVTAGFMVPLTYLLIKPVVSYVVHSIMRLLRHKHTLPLAQLVIIRSVQLEELGEKTTTTFHLERERERERERAILGSYKIWEQHLYIVLFSTHALCFLMCDSIYTTFFWPGPKLLLYSSFVWAYLILDHPPLIELYPCMSTTQ